jgi:hypothetical protein
MARHDFAANGDPALKARVNRSFALGDFAVSCAELIYRS